MAPLAVRGRYLNETERLHIDRRSAIGTLLGHSTRWVMLIRLPHGRSAELMREALTRTITPLPRHLLRSLTWDQGSEMGSHGAFTLATDRPI
ncbi:hypothetical protein ABZ801_37980 [Actinomadura sp. NPDC047616]|uniref:hypothetical protein n=1 Tax=Actinomadura sp. NPDC047616 TaxID=3155914 RepID=UPI0033F4FC71